MSLLDLKSLVSVEDFADAHEPLNDGVKEVPNAKTVAASVGTGDVGNDTTTQGPAKVVPEKPDTDDATKTEHNVVKESAEKTSTPKAEGDAEASAEPAEVEETDEAKEPLEHTSEKSAKDELEKTERATTALEAYAPNAKKFDIIGHPKVKAAEVGKMVGFLQRRSGIKGEPTVSAESISAAVDLGRARIAKLEREVRILGSQTVSKEDLTEEIEVTEQPTAHGAPPLAPEAAAALTEVETDPLDVPLLEIEKVQETIQTLEAGQATLEQYRQIIRDNPRMSKQAAAVLHAGLEHIDQVCGLKVRSTGLESYVTTPRAAMEEADVDEKSISSRANEIGAKLLKWLKVLMEKVAHAWNTYRTGLSGLKDKYEELKKHKFPTEGEFNLKPAPALLFMRSVFVGDLLTPEEVKLAKKINTHYKGVTREILHRLDVMLKKNDVDDIVMFAEALLTDPKLFSMIPGPKWITDEGGKLVLTEGEVKVPDWYTVDLDLLNVQAIFNGTIRSIDEFLNLNTVELLKQSTNDVVKMLLAYRNGPGKELDESEFQKVQTAVINSSVKLFDADSYFDILKNVGAIYNARYKMFSAIAKNKSE